MCYTVYVVVHKKTASQAEAVFFMPFGELSHPFHLNQAGL
jgi:hypothetical protein